MRVRVYQLDWCLGQLEEAHLRGEQRVSATLAARVARHVTGVVVGATIVHALDIVFKEQARHLAGPRRKPITVPTDPSPAGAELLSTEPLDPAAARALTARIRTTTKRLCLLILLAHQRRAWHALGYRSWSEYVVAELGISRSRSYELVEQGLVVRELCRAAGLNEMPNVSALAAVQIKPHLTTVAREVATRTVGMSQARAVKAVVEVVREMRLALGLGRRRGQGRPADLRARRELRTSLRILAAMPDAAQVAARVRDPATLPPDLIATALGWLREFAGRWEAGERLSDAS